jgi:hypothetical protein
MSPALASLRRAVEYGLENGKRNVIADLAPLKELFDSHAVLLALAERLATADDRGWGDACEMTEEAARLTAKPNRPTAYPSRSTHPDRGGTVAVTCPKCNTPVTQPADPVDHADDRVCPVCNGQLPYLPARAGGT